MTFRLRLDRTTNSIRQSPNRPSARCSFTHTLQSQQTRPAGRLSPSGRFQTTSPRQCTMDGAFQIGISSSLAPHRPLDESPTLPARNNRTGLAPQFLGIYAEFRKAAPPKTRPYRLAPFASRWVVMQRRPPADGGDVICPHCAPRHANGAPDMTAEDGCIDGMVPGSRKCAGLL